MCFLRTFDCYRDVPLTFRMFGTMFTDFNAAQIPAGLTGLGLSAWDYGILALGTVLLVLVSLLQRSGSVREKIYRWNYWARRRFGGVVSSGAFVGNLWDRLRCQPVYL